MSYIFVEVGSICMARLLRTCLICMVQLLDSISQRQIWDLDDLLSNGLPIDDLNDLSVDDLSVGCV